MYPAECGVFSRSAVPDSLLGVWNRVDKGVYVLAGPDAGQLLVRIDGRDWQIVELYHGYSSGLHYPRTVMFACDLKRGPHLVEVKLGDQHHAQSQGHAARILSFVANGGT